MARSRLVARAAVGIGLALVLIGVFALPPRSVPASTPTPPGQIAGAFHVHSRRSDGAGSVEQIAQEAARAGLDFVVLTDHGDATRPPDAPSYRSGVLCLDGIEISTRDGHYLALDMPVASFPLAGDGRDVAADVRRFGGFGVVAHPDSAKAELRWTDDLDVDGLEWINADSEWRDESYARLITSLFVYGLRGPETLAALLDRPVATFARWDAALARRQVVGLPGADAHGKIGRREEEDGGSSFAVDIPRYGAMFRSFSLRILLDRPLTGDAAVDANMLYAALRAGHAFSVIDGIAAPGAVDFLAESGSAMAHMGDRLPLDGPVEVSAHVEAPAGAELVLLRDGIPVHRSAAPTLTYRLEPVPAVIRLEGHAGGAPGSPPVPWLVSNPIYLGAPPLEAATVRVEPSLDEGAPGRRVRLAERARWASETDATSRATLTTPDLDDVIRLQFALGPDREANAFVALHHPLDAADGALEWILFRAWADLPGRLSVQLRDAGAAGRRWQRSVHVDPTPRSYAVAVTDMRATDVRNPDPTRPDASDSLLFVIDTVNTPPGAQGTISLRDVTLVTR